MKLIFFFVLGSSLTQIAISQNLKIETWNPPSNAGVVLQGKYAQEMKKFLLEDEAGSLSVASDDLVVQIGCSKTDSFCRLNFQEPTWLEDANWQLNENSLSFSFEKQRGKVLVMRLKMPPEPIQNAYIIQDKFTFFVSKNGTIAFTIER